MPAIESFVFFDIETTGLPWQENNLTKIIEFSFVAALRKDIEATPYESTPPVSKLTVLLNPQRRIHPEVTQMTGLSNEILCHAPHFRQKVKSMISFLEDLSRPVCLVAHNGNRFDFKILLSECNEAGVQLPEDLLCVDSLNAFRDILKGSSVTYKDLKGLPTSSIDDLLTDDEDETDWPDLNVSCEEWDEIDDLCESISDVSFEEQELDLKQKRSEAISKVFNKSISIKNENIKQRIPEMHKTDYKLTTLYKRLLNKEEINAHRAEADCIMLAQCVVALKNDFLPWADKNCKPLNKIKPLR